MKREQFQTTNKSKEFLKCLLSWSSIFAIMLVLHCLMLQHCQSWKEQPSSCTVPLFSEIYHAYLKI